MPAAEWHNFAVPILTALIGYGLGRRASKLNRRDDLAQQSSERRRRFREDMRLIKHRIEHVDWRKFQDAWRGTLTEFEADCVRIEADIPHERRQHFVTARDRYINRKQADGSYPAGKGYHEQPVGMPKLCDRQREMKQILLPFMDEVIEYAD